MILLHRPHSTYRLANMLIRIQMREGMVVFLGLFVSITLVLYVRPSSCASQIITILGIVPLQVQL